MFTTIRKHQRWLMLLIAALTIIAFAFLYNTTEVNRVGANMVAKIYGRTVMQVDVEKALRNYQLSLALGQFELVRGLAGRAKTEDEAANNFIWNLMVLQHEARALDVEPGEQEIVERIKSLPVFQQDGRFDPVKYSDFVQQQLAPRGFTERQLEDVIRDSLRLEGIKALVESPAMILPGDIEPVLARMAPVDVVLVEFDPAIAAEDVAVSDEELRKAFDERKESLQAPEMRSLRYVAFTIPKDTDKEGKERIKALQKVSAATSDFAQALADSGKGMADFGKDKKMKVLTTPFFDAKGVPDGKVSESDADVIAAAKSVAFRLQQKAGGYEIVELGDKGYAVIEVEEVRQPRPLEFDEARAGLHAELIVQKRNKAIAEKAAKELPELREKLAAGKPLAEIARESGLKLQEMKGLNVFDEKLKPDEREIAMAASGIPEGKLSDLQDRAGGSGGFAIYVAKRGELDAKVLAERKPMIEQGALQGKKMLLFAQWLADARRQSDLRVLRPAM